MPELAEVEHSRRVWEHGRGKKVSAVVVRNVRCRVWRGTRPAQLIAVLTGRALTDSAAHGKQMLFRFGRDAWLGVHLGMTGRLSLEAQDYRPRKHDHLMLRQAGQSLVFSDPRRFGRVRLARGSDVPAWWSELPPAILSDGFTPDLVKEFCNQRRRTPLKTLLLKQERFPGIGNWMADEILWRAKLHPNLAAGDLSASALGKLYRSTRSVAASALESMDENWEFPRSWLFKHRWDSDGRCPRCGTCLKWEKIGSRTSCWCSNCQQA